MSTYVHPSAHIDSGASIGDNTKIWHNCHVMGTAIIGDNCVLGHNVFIGSGVIIGSGCKIQNNVSIFEGVQIEDEVFVGPHVCFTNVINPRAFIERKHEFKTTIVRQGASIGANSTIVCGNNIGRYAMIGAGSVVTKNVGSNELWYGGPATKRGYVTQEGEVTNVRGRRVLTINNMP